MTHFQRRRWLGLAFLAPYALSFLGFIVLPIVVSAVLSFMQFDLTAPNATRFVGSQNFKEAWGDEYFWDGMKATMRFVVLMVPGMLVFAFAAALGLNAMSRGRSAVRAIIFLPGMLNVAVAAILWRWFYDGQFGFLNFQLKRVGMAPVPWIDSPTAATPSIVLMSLWWTMGGTTIVLLAALQQIPRQIIEAAALDGAGRGAMFRRVVLPLLTPAISKGIISSPSRATIQRMGRMKRGPDFPAQYIVFGHWIPRMAEGRVSDRISMARRPGTCLRSS